MKSVMEVGLCPLLNYVWGAIDRINGQKKERERERVVGEEAKQVQREVAQRK